MVCITK